MKGYIKPYCKHNGYCYDDCHLLCAVFKCRTEAAKQQKDELKSRQKRTVMQSKITTGKHIQHISLSLTLLISFYRLALTPFLFCLTQPLICFSTLLLRLSPSAAPVVSLLYWIPPPAAPSFMRLSSFRQTQRLFLFLCHPGTESSQG